MEFDPVSHSEHAGRRRCRLDYRCDLDRTSAFVFINDPVYISHSREYPEIFSREDITHGLLGVPHFAVDGYAPESAFAVLRNIVLTAGK